MNDLSVSLLRTCFCCSFFFPSSLVLSSSGLMTIFGVVFELVFLICLCINCRFLVCSYSEVLIEESIYIHEFVLSCWSLNCKCISSVLHLYPRLLMISDFAGIIVHGLFHILTVYISSLVSLVICGIFVSCCCLFFSA